MHLTPDYRETRAPALANLMEYPGLELLMFILHTIPVTQWFNFVNTYTRYVKWPSGVYCYCDINLNQILSTKKNYQSVIPVSQ